MTTVHSTTQTATDAPVWSSFVDGAFVAPSEPYPLFDPASPETIVAYACDASEEDIDRSVASAKTAQAVWMSMPTTEREAALTRFLSEIEARSEQIATQMTLEQGKIIAEARGEVGKALGEGRFMLGELQRWGTEAMPSTRPNGVNLIRRLPYGVVAAINPWNFPVSTPMRKIMPALVAGNAIILKPSEFTPGPLVLLAQAAAAAGLPNGLIGVVIGRGAKVGAALVDHTGVDMVTFTGSTSTGRIIARSAAERFLPLQLEMGGKNAAIVTATADIALAADQITKAAMVCAGQRCTAISRVIVLDEIADALSEALTKSFEGLTTGPGLAEGSHIGPLVSEAHRDSVHRHVMGAVKAGAHLLTGGAIPNQDGWFYPPTLLDHVQRDAEISCNEVFGPVVTVHRVSGLDEALAIHDDPEYGLTASIFATDKAEIDTLLEGIRAGMTHVNVGTFPENNMPFAGAKNSSFGAPSVGFDALDGFCRIQSVYR